ncbi:MAG: dethiobiotin synthase [Candidatus Nitrosotenuis sp.]
MKSLFVTATDTEIGKTVITASLAFALKISGIDVGVMKPFACGTQQKEGFKSEDAQLLAKYAGVADSEDLVNPYFFPVAASPYTAANKLGASIDIEIVLQKFEKLQQLHDVVLVEGIGGIMTPIQKNYCIADLIKDMDLKTLVITSAKIGTVNHTILTCEASKRYGLTLCGLIINNYDSTGYVSDELADDLTNLTGVETLCIVPHLDDFSIHRISKILQKNNLIEKLSF